ncbi:MAG: HD domain-containing protein [Flavobacteriales bacterium]|nr:HD domain-containing protein [Flavobacteriales bacterium]
MQPNLQDIQLHVTHLFETAFVSDLPYHSLQHTLQVTEVLQELCRLEAIDETQTKLACIASLFHDTGYYLDRMAHEAAGAKLASQYLSEHVFSASDIALVARLIQTTTRNEPPADQLEAIVHDADLHYLGTTDYMRQADLLRKEWAEFDQRTYSDRKWFEINLSFMEAHTFYTRTAQQLFQETKNHNIRLVKTLLEKL